MSKLLGQDAGAATPETLASDARALADALHGGAWMLMRRMRPLERLEGVSGPAIWTLSSIVEHPGITPSALAHDAAVSLPTVSRAVKELDEAGLIERRPDPNDRRTQRLHATALGGRRLKDGRRRRISRLAVALQTLDVKDRVALARAAALLKALGNV
jgi:DNA-binding MarR family transcriptional regulator